MSSKTIAVKKNQETLKSLYAQILHQTARIERIKILEKMVAKSKVKAASGKSVIKDDAAAKKKLKSQVKSTHMLRTLLTKCKIQFDDRPTMLKCLESIRTSFDNALKPESRVALSKLLIFLTGEVKSVFQLVSKLAEDDNVDEILKLDVGGVVDSESKSGLTAKKPAKKKKTKNLEDVK
ncbi:hypothetical protein HK098_000098 [Nowakowskiella sp. JEL0407]|nr:hypothetical protein HK098_000098 [Nowakowskiella sp. JEL0407]